MEEHYVHLGKHLKQRREAAGLSQEELVSLLAGMGVSIQTPQLSRIENGSRRPSVEVLRCLALLLDVSIDDYLLAPQRAVA